MRWVWACHKDPELLLVHQDERNSPSLRGQGRAVAHHSLMLCVCVCVCVCVCEVNSHVLEQFSIQFAQASLT